MGEGEGGREKETGRERGEEDAAAWGERLLES